MSAITSNIHCPLSCTLRHASTDQQNWQGKQQVRKARCVDCTSSRNLNLRSIKSARLDKALVYLPSVPSFAFSARIGQLTAADPCFQSARSTFRIGARISVRYRRSLSEDLWKCMLTRFLACLRWIRISRFEYLSTSSRKGITLTGSRKSSRNSMIPVLRSHFLDLRGFRLNILILPNSRGAQAYLDCYSRIMTENFQQHPKVNHSQSDNSLRKALCLTKRDSSVSFIR